jgi:hypothetical protein
MQDFFDQVVADKPSLENFGSKEEYFAAYRSWFKKWGDAAAKRGYDRGDFDDRLRNMWEDTEDLARRKFGPATGADEDSDNPGEYNEPETDSGDGQNDYYRRPREYKFGGRY